MTAQTFADLIEDFAILDDWEDRYGYVIELGKTLPPFDEALRTPAHRVEGCVSQVWLHIRLEPETAAGEAILRFDGDSDALIVKGLIAILRILLNGKPAGVIADTDIAGQLKRLGLHDHLTPQRSNGLAAMIRRIRAGIHPEPE